MLKIFKFIRCFLYFLERSVYFLVRSVYFLVRSERNYPRIFWLCTCLFGFYIFHEPVTTSSQSQIVMEEVRGGGSKSDSSSFSILTPTNPSFVTPICLSKKKNFDPAFHRRLEKYFPDSKGRMDYQKRQEKFYKLAMKRKRELIRTKMPDKKSYYTKEELDAMDYFHGTGFYKKLQDPEVRPNIFDTRQSFLRKMHNPIELDNFLKYFNSKNKKN